MPCFFASDIHGRPGRYRTLWRLIAAERPEALFLGGDLLPHHFDQRLREELGVDEFAGGFLIPGFRRLREELGRAYPRIFLILGNDDPRCEEEVFLRAAADGLWEYLHMGRAELGPHAVFGYACVPPTPFQLKDWERYDVSRFVDPGCVSPEEGRRTVPVAEHEIRHGTIAGDLARLTGQEDLRRAICLMHSPPYETKLDRAALDGKQVDGVPLDAHIGSIAIRRFIAERQPLLTLHGHVHESTELTGAWRDRIGMTHLFNAAHHGPELSLVRFDPGDLARATRELC
ncbi:MAG: metallophosphoesterase [Candidatus Eisenbacteria bacterium]|uniref:Metallophosphoesterase n=1 Tax=Eiseniibacteriota bacterium TaxID=2212470 RepID=A0A937X9N9_UNCEI|nr:metallophosphoesterase [Candidatus Eisenbacteria bacterium]